MSAVFNLDRQIASAPEAMRKILADAVDLPELDHGRPIIFTGIGTSLHAARVAAGWICMLTGGKIRAQALDAHDVGTWAPLRPDDQAIVISHRCSKVFPRACRGRGARGGRRHYCDCRTDRSEPGCRLYAAYLRQRDRGNVHRLVFELTGGARPSGGAIR